MERALVERARSGDRAAFDDLVRSRIDAVYRTSLAIVGDRGDAADATQETFVSAWCHRAALREPDSFDAWLGRISLNACRRQLRRRGRTRVREIRLVDPEDEREPASPERALDDRTADADVFDRAFARLSVDDRAVLVLHHFQERPVAEIAAVLGAPAGTIKSRLHRARAALESALTKEAR
ncbi:MAG: sigma-70 family RNA polymerase sigma factor [Candidatus Limnocylindrales bacterium]|jgi:RNA polymerase sigma-70 factor (ECF subfamily)